MAKAEKKEVVTPVEEKEYKERPKELRYRIEPGTSLYNIYFQDGGEVPKALKGLYTSSSEAQKSIISYEASRRKYIK